MAPAMFWRKYRIKVCSKKVQSVFLSMKFSSGKYVLLIRGLNIDILWMKNSEALMSSFAIRANVPETQYGKINISFCRRGNQNHWTGMICWQTKCFQCHADFKCRSYWYRLESNIIFWIHWPIGKFNFELTFLFNLFTVLLYLITFIILSFLTIRDDWS